MRWDDIYRRSGRVWGQAPSELAAAAVAYLQRYPLPGVPSVLDIGCGYGRDAGYFLDNVRCTFAGIDDSPRAIEIAASSLAERHKRLAAFRCRSFVDLPGEAHDVVFLSNVFQVLGKDDRVRLAEAVRSALKPGGLLFLSTLAVGDPAHYGKGTPVPGDPESFEERTFLHFAAKDELTAAFPFVNIAELYQLEYHETLNASGEHHHHISWILVGRRLGG